jgi:multidrug resistance efflux pump
MTPLPLIPTPPSQRRKDFRLQRVPFIVFALAAVAIFIMWTQNLAPTTFTGEVESVQENVASWMPGQLADLRVDLFQTVRAGDVVARIITTDPKILEASLAVIRAEVDLLKTEMAPILNQHRDAVNYEQLRLSWLVQRVDLASARVRLEFANSELERVKRLFEEKIVPQGAPIGGDRNSFGYDVALRDREALRTEVDEREKLVSEMELKLRNLKLPEHWENAQTNNPAISAAIAVQDEKLRLTEAQLTPLTLKAPMDGTVNKLYRRSGETIVAGDPIFSISSPRSRRIIGYLRQPLAFEPKVGDPVNVYTRRPHHAVATAKILQVGAQMELLTAPLRLRGSAPAMDRGLPILLDLPAGLNVHPGELVDLVIRPGS